MDIDTKTKLKPILLRSKLGQFVSQGNRSLLVVVGASGRRSILRCKLMK
jgi:hypothetical protein